MKSFEGWFEELKTLARTKDGFSDKGIETSFDNQPELYREYFNDGLSAEDALEVSMDRA